MIPKKLLFIINPHSGRMKAKAGLFEMLDELYRFDAPSPIGGAEESHGISSAYDPAEESDSPVYGRITPTTLGGEPDSGREITVAPTMYRGHATQLAASAAAGGYDTVVCCGGDGTLNETITGLMSISSESRPALGYIPAGSTNDFASSLGLPTTLRDAARMAVADCEAPVDIGYFCPVGEGKPGRYFSYIASFGLFTSVSYSTSQSLKNVLGHTAYVLEGMRDLTNMQHHHATFVLADGTRLEGDYIFGAVANTTTVGGILHLPGEGISMADGAFEVFLIRAPETPAELNRLSLALASGNFDNCPCIEFHHTSSVQATMTAPLSWSLDGEEATAGTRIRMNCIGGAIKLKATADALFEW